ncbi:MAG: ABC transporter permease subunit [Clostridia bacterium]
MKTNQAVANNATTSGKTQFTKLQKLKRKYANFDLYLMLVPMLLLVFLFSYRPLSGLLIAFKDYSPRIGIWDSPWVGFEYFIEYFNGAHFSRTVINTLVISFGTLIFGFPAPIILALLLNEVSSVKFRRLVQTVSYIPHFVSMVVVCSMVTTFLSPTTGVVNSILNLLGKESVFFLADVDLFVPIYLLVNIWKTTGYSSIVYIASLTSIPEDLYEAARIDGANRWKQTWHVTLPGLLPTIVVMLLVQLGSILEIGYEMIILLYSPAVYESADVITTYSYRTGILEGRYDYATAIGLCNSFVSFIIVIAANMTSRRLTETSLW